MCNTSMTLTELIEGYKSGEISMEDPLWLDNDTTFVYVGDEDAGETPQRIFHMHPYDLMNQLLEYVGIPYEGV